MKSQERLAQADVDIVNNWLKNKYGIDIIQGLPIWRVVWAADQVEKQYDTFEDHTPSGIFIREVTEVREIKKYPHVTDLHILERLVLVPEHQQENLVGAKISYELIFNFWNKHGEYLPPKIEVCEFVIDTVLAAEHAAKGGRGGMRKYTDETNEEFLNKQRKRIEEITEYIWGEDAAFHDDIRSGSGILMPSNYQRSR